MAQARVIESAILHDLERRGPCALEELVRDLPAYTWNQVFAAIDRLSREARVTLRRPSRFDYRIALAPAREGKRRAITPEIPSPEPAPVG